MVTIYRVLALSIGLIALSPAVGSAQHFHIEFGHGHHHHHHRHHHHGWSVGLHDCFWDDWCYRPREYVYVVPPPRTTYIVPSPAPSLSSNDSWQNRSSRASDAVVRSNTLPAGFKGRGVTITNPRTSGYVLSMVVDGETEVTLSPGDSKPLTGKSSYVVEYDRGGDNGIGRTELQEGDYEFAVTASGWALVKKTPSASTQTATRPVVKKNQLPSRVQ